MASPKTRIYKVAQDGTKTLAGEFQIRNGKVSSRYTAEGAWLKEYLEGDGILVGGKATFPSDGARFYRGLPLAYANSTYVSVEVSQ